MNAILHLSKDGRILFGTRMLRLFGYGFLSIALGLYLNEIGFSSNPAFLGLPFDISGALKIIYDLALYFNFRNVKPPEEQ